MRSPMVAGSGDSSASRIAGRYRVDRELARGGMGVVYAVFDESTASRVALKRLDPHPGSGSTRRKGPASDRDRALRFELEYTILRRLKHPSIIDVYDYGVDELGPYYTMELLDGRDLSELAPDSFREACRRARDVASSLALLHAHRLVHRDISPRNVRATHCGRSKLFDFGTLTPFGVPNDVAGTPSTVPPEALDGGPLDHRADLYSLGCLLYFLLTGRAAFPARRLEDLPRLFETIPLPPSTFAPAVPERLDALVLSMLSRDPLARPSSAAEVIERLDALARLEPEARQEVAESYFLSAKTVGRSLELGTLSGVLGRALSGAGSGVWIEGDRGLGKTRLARETALAAQLRGAVTIVADGRLSAALGATLSALGKRLLQVAPELGKSTALPHAAHLSNLVPEIASAPASHDPSAPIEPPGEWRARREASFKAWLLDFARQRPLVVVVDNIEHADQSSATAIASLAEEARHCRLLVVATSRTCGASIGDSFATKLILGPLDPEAVNELVRSLFGGAPRSDRFAWWLHALGAGNPLDCMQLVSHLVANRVARYANGAWTLPEDTRLQSLPKSVEEAVLARLARLRPPVRELAESLSACAAPIPLSLCVALGKEGPQAERLQIALFDELVSEGVLVGSGDRYRFAEESLRERLLEGLERERLGKLHERIGRALSESDHACDLLAAGFHLLQGGEEERGAALLAAAGRRLIDEADDLSAAVPALEAALAVYRTRDLPAHELVSLVGPLATAAYFADRRLSDKYGAEALELFQRAIGLVEIRDTAGDGAIASLAAAVAVATANRRLQGDSSGVNTRDLIALFLRCATALAGVSAVCLDAAGIQRVVEALAPLSSLGDGHGATWVYRYCHSLQRIVEGRFGAAKASMLGVLRELESGRPLRAFPEGARRLLIGGALYALGAIENLSDRSRALEYAEQLESLDLRLYRMVADQLRMLHHAQRGERDLAKRYRERVEASAMARGASWQIEVWELPATMLTYVQEGDLVNLKRTAERLASLAQQIPSLAPQSHVARAAYLRLRGDYGAAKALLEPLVAGTAGVGTATAVGVLADVYNALGEHENAEHVTREFSSRMSPEDRPFARAGLLAVIQHARALAGMGDVALARSELDGALDEHAGSRGPLTLGLLHQARARLALEEGDEHAFETHCAAMETWFRPTGNPALISACERLRHEGRRGYAFVGGDDLFDTGVAPTTSRRLLQG